VLFVVPFRPPDGGTDVGVDGGDGPAPITMAVLPPAVRLPEEIVMRGSDEQPAPQEIPLPAGAESIVLELITSIEAEDLADPGSTFRVEIESDDRVVRTVALRGNEFDRRGRLQLMLDPGAFAIGAVNTVRIALESEGDVRDKEQLYRKSFRLVRSETN